MIYYNIKDEVLAWCRQDPKFEFMMEGTSKEKATLTIKLKDNEPEEFVATIEEARPFFYPWKRTNLMSEFEDTKRAMVNVVRNKMIQSKFPFLVNYMEDKWFTSWDENGKRLK